MCGRFALTADREIVTNQFGITHSFVLLPRYNIAPMQLVPVICKWGTLEFMQWGLGVKSYINVHYESKLPYAKPCLIIASGFYHWRLVSRGKQPYYCSLQAEPVFAFAGFYNKNGCAIVTRELIDKSRAPLILATEQYQPWLTNAIINEIVEHKFQQHPVSTKVNNPDFDSAVCIQSL